MEKVLAVIDSDFFLRNIALTLGVLAVSFFCMFLIKRVYEYKYSTLIFLDEFKIPKHNGMIAEEDVWKVAEKSLEMTTKNGYFFVVGYLLAEVVVLVSIFLLTLILWLAFGSGSLLESLKLIAKMFVSRNDWVPLLIHTIPLVISFILFFVLKPKKVDEKWVQENLGHNPPQEVEQEVQANQRPYMDMDMRLTPGLNEPSEPRPAPREMRKPAPRPKGNARPQGGRRPAGPQGRPRPQGGPRRRPRPRP